MTLCLECKTVEQKRKFLNEMVEECCPWARAAKDDTAFRTVVLLFAALAEGTNPESLTVLTGYPPEFVAEISFLARNAGLWVNDGVCYDNWFERDKIKPVAMMCDLFVLEGVLIRLKCDDGKIRYKAAQSC